LELFEESVIRDFVDRKTLSSINNALIRPHFDYCSEVWDALGVGLSSRLQKLQNRAAKIIMNLRYNTPGIEAINALAIGWEPIETRRAKSKVKQMYKVLNDLAPSSLAALFVRIIHIDSLDVLWFLKKLLKRAFDCQSAVFNGQVIINYMEKHWFTITYKNN
jgi:hypothetical protein